MSGKINCPFCGNIIEKDTIRCSKCGSLFSEPELPKIKFQEFRTFVALEILTYGFFGILWFFINCKSINDLCNTAKDRIKLNWLVFLLLINLGGYIFYISQFSNHFVLSAFVIAQILIFIALTYRVIRIIQKYTLNAYDTELEFNPYYIAIFNILYLIHFIDTYADRVNQVHEYFSMKSPQMIFLIFLLLVIQFMACLNTNLHSFYKWLFSL
jgi:hypothetical protein